MRWRRTLISALSFSLLAPAFTPACGASDGPPPAIAPASTADAGSRSNGSAAPAPAAAESPPRPRCPPVSPPSGPATLASINHFVVIYMENHSFDNLYGEFPGVDGLDAGAAPPPQIAGDGGPYATLPIPPMGLDGKGGQMDANLPNRPFAIEEFIEESAPTRDLHHLFFTEQRQINGGKMNGFVYWSDAKALTMGHYHTMNLPAAREAQNWTLCDHFFHAAFGGSFLNHQFLIAAAPPVWDPAAKPIPASLLDDPAKLTPGAGEGSVWHDKVTNKYYVVNTAFSVNPPWQAHVPVESLIPVQRHKTIGDRLDEAKPHALDWAWYSGGWDDAMAYAEGRPVPDGGLAPATEEFQYHHQPFVYFAEFADRTEARKAHLKDEKEFFVAAASGTLPAVSFVKPVGIDNEHPGYADVLDGDKHLLSLIEAVKCSPNWKDTAIIVTYDEHGGFWDHVPPRVIDAFGPGLRVPTLVISPFAKKGGYVDHTMYDTTSILATIEKRWNLAPLTARDRTATPMDAAFDFAH